MYFASFRLESGVSKADVTHVSYLTGAWEYIALLTQFMSVTSMKFPVFGVLGFASSLDFASSSLPFLLRNET